MEAYIIDKIKREREKGNSSRLPIIQPHIPTISPDHDYYERKEREEEKKEKRVLIIEF